MRRGNAAGDTTPLTGVLAVVNIVDRLKAFEVRVYNFALLLSQPGIGYWQICVVKHRNTLIFEVGKLVIRG